MKIIQFNQPQNSQQFKQKRYQSFQSVYNFPALQGNFTRELQNPQQELGCTVDQPQQGSRVLQHTLVWLGSHEMYQREEGKSFSVVVSLLTANRLHTETCCSPRPPSRVIIATTYNGNHHSDCSVTRETNKSINVATVE